MKLTGERALPVPIEVAWQSLFDPDILQACIPGCESVTKDGEAQYLARVAVAVGPLKARFSGALTIADAQPPQRCTLVFEGSAGAMGMAKGSAQVLLEAVEAGTRLLYTADTQITGKLAQVGARLIDSVAQKLSAQFFDRFEKTLAAAEEG